MDKAEYLAQLGQRLKGLPPGDLKDALDYYDGYISDSGDEAAAITQLGSPAEVASQILSNYVQRKSGGDVPRGKGIGVKTLWGIVIAFAAPIAIPLAAAAAMLVISLFIAILAIGVSGAAAFIVGVLGIVITPFAFFEHFGYALYIAGSGFVCIGVGIMLLDATKKLWRAGAAGVMKFLTRKSKA